MNLLQRAKRGWLMGIPNSSSGRKFRLYEWSENLQDYVRTDESAVVNVKVLDSESSSVTLKRVSEEI